MRRKQHMGAIADGQLFGHRLSGGFQRVDLGE